MNDLDVLADRLHQLGQTAPVPHLDPLSDIRRGRVALRRRHARTTACVTTTLVAVGAVAATAPHLALPGAGRDTDIAVAPAAAPSVAAPSPTTAPAAPSVDDFCGPTIGSTITAKDGARALFGGTPGERPWKNPLVAPTLAAYRQAAVAALDPAGRHLDHEVSGVQSGCANVGGTVEITELGTKLGWTSGNALGMVQIDVTSPKNDQDPQVVINHLGQWTAYAKTLPPGVTTARIASYVGGYAVVAERTDGLTVAIDAEGVWGNNAAPGSPAVKDLPGTGALLTLAASPQLTLPES